MLIIQPISIWLNKIIEWSRGLVTTSFNFQKLKVETAMEDITDIVNSDIKTNSEDSDSIENSMKTGSEEIEIFENSEKKTDIEEKNFFINSDKKTDNEKTKNPSQRGGENRGCQEDSEKSMVEEQPKKGIPNQKVKKDSHRSSKRSTNKKPLVQRKKEAKEKTERENPE